MGVKYAVNLPAPCVNFSSVVAFLQFGLVALCSMAVHTSCAQPVRCFDDRFEALHSSVT